VEARELELKCSKLSVIHETPEFHAPEAEAPQVEFELNPRSVHEESKWRVQGRRNSSSSCAQGGLPSLGGIGQAEFKF
jgi:hypothetical protein